MSEKVFTPVTHVGSSYRKPEPPEIPPSDLLPVLEAISLLSEVLSGDQLAEKKMWQWFINGALIPVPILENGSRSSLEQEESFWIRTDKGGSGGPQAALRGGIVNCKYGNQSVPGWIYVPKAEFTALVDSLRSELSPESGVAGKKRSKKSRRTPRRQD